MELSLLEQLEPAVVPNIIWLNIDFTLEERCILGYMVQGYVKREERTVMPVSKILEWSSLPLRRLSTILRRLEKQKYLVLSSKRVSIDTQVELYYN